MNNFKIHYKKVRHPYRRVSLNIRITDMYNLSYDYVEIYSVHYTRRNPENVTDIMINLPKFQEITDFERWQRFPGKFNSKEDAINTFRKAVDKALKDIEKSKILEEEIAESKYESPS